MIEQQKRKGPELPLVPVKRQRHELLLGTAGSGPGTGQQPAAPGALLQAVSGGAHGPGASALPGAVPGGPARREREALPGAGADECCESALCGSIRIPVHRTVLGRPAGVSRAAG